MEFVRKNKNKKKSNSSSSSSLKVVYISSPMKVKTTASKFRSLVQALTGRDSDITKSMDIVQSCNNIDNPFDNIPPPPSPQNPTFNNLSKSDNIPNQEHQHQHQHHYQQQQHNFMDYFSYPILDQTNDSSSPTSSDSLIDQQSFGGEAFGVSTQVEEDQFLQLQDDVFTSSLFTDQFSLQGHLIGCYDAL